MKRLILIRCLFSFIVSYPFASIAQRPADLPLQKNIYKGFYWFRKNVTGTSWYGNGWKYELSGNEYEIEIEYFPKTNAIPSTQKILVKSLSAGFEKKSERTQRNIAEWPLPNYIFLATKKTDSLDFHTAIYVIPDLIDSAVYRIKMLTYNNRDSVLERNIVGSIVYDGISDSLFLAPGPNMIEFAGRLITITTPFRWMGPQNIFCPGHGQMNWTVHNTLANAYRARDLQLKKNANVKNIPITKTDTVTVSMEGYKQQALRVTYYAKVPGIFWGKGSHTLIVYYIVMSIRGRFIHCVLSHYDDQLIDDDVPPPLNSVMSLK